MIWEAKAMDIVVFEESILHRARGLLPLNIKEKDALHISCAIHSNADFFITTDKKLIGKKVDGITILNPIDFLRSYYNAN